jgi:hypothetical protein
MNDEPDDNPFARNSAWPKMPQTPFRVGPMPKAEPFQPAPQKITPLFVRPIEAPPVARLDIGGGVPPGPPAPVRPQAAAAIARDPVDVPSPSPDPSTSGPMVSDRVEPVEVSPVIVTPIRRPRPKARRPVWPAAVAALVGIAGILGLALLLSEVQQAALKPETPPPIPALANAPTPDPAPAPPLPAEAEPPLVVAPMRAGAPKPGPVQAPARFRPAAEASTATTEAFSAPALSLPEAPQPPVYRPPPEADPAAPVVTREPNS